ncbi:FKBP-type peptidyl-prolyl cis-trans isomerase [Kaarinaea lacus]
MRESISNKNVVTFTYQILDEDGNIVEHSDVPMEYIHGASGAMYPKVEQALEGKVVGVTVEVVLSPKDGFGEHDPNLTFTDHIDNVPQEYRWVGAKPAFENESGEVMELLVSKIEGDQLTVDANHPLAGKTVTFRIKVLDVRKASAAELSGNVSPGPGTLQ